MRPEVALLFGRSRSTKLGSKRLMRRRMRTGGAYQSGTRGGFQLEVLYSCLLPRQARAPLSSRTAAGNNADCTHSPLSRSSSCQAIARRVFSVRSVKTLQHGTASPCLVATKWPPPVIFEEQNLLRGIHDTPIKECVKAFSPHQIHKTFPRLWGKVQRRVDFIDSFAFPR